MKNLLIGLLLISVLVLGWRVFSQREQVHQLNAKLEAMSKATSFELQEK